jgi:MFS transporter, MHS family, proline/betaine transporter
MERIQQSPPPVSSAAETVEVPEHRAVVRKAILAAAVGNFVEWFDYGIYGFLAATLATVFFPAENSATQIISVLGIFGLGFLIRPLGGIYFGAAADKIGRKRVLIITVLIMSAATCLIGVLPTYALIGVWAPGLLLVLRLIQGFGAGGEIGASMVIITEYSPPRRRGLTGSMVQLSSFVAFVLGAALVLILTVALPSGALASWGWRIPFLVALPVGLLGLYLRLRIEETPQFRALRDEEKTSSAPNRDVVKTATAALFVVAGLTATTAVGHWLLLTYMTSYLSATLGFSSLQAILITTIGVVCACISIPLAGLASDRFGRRRMLIVSTVLLAIFVYPCFLLFASGPLGLAILGIALFGALVGLFDGGLTATLAEMFLTRNRAAGISLPYNISAAIFGGGVPYVAAALVQATGNNQAGAALVIIAALISLVSTLLIAKALHGKFVAGQPFGSGS